VTEVPYTTNDLVLLIGQATVELAYLRARVASLEAQVAASQEKPPNGLAEVIPERVTAQ